MKNKFILYFYRTKRMRIDEKEKLFFINDKKCIIFFQPWSPVTSVISTKIFEAKLRKT